MSTTPRSLDVPAEDASLLREIHAALRNLRYGSVEITVHDHAHRLVSGVTVRGSWGGPNVGECVTGEAGTCTVTLSLPITTGPGTVAVMISLGFTRSSYASAAEELFYVAMILLAAIAIAVAIYVCFAYADRAERILGHTGTDIAVRLSAFILFCIGVQILWSGAVELWASLPAHAPSPLPASKAGGA